MPRAPRRRHVSHSGQMAAGVCCERNVAGITRASQSEPSWRGAASASLPNVRSPWQQCRVAGAGRRYDRKVGGCAAEHCHVVSARAAETLAPRSDEDGVGATRLRLPAVMARVDGRRRANIQVDLRLRRERRGRNCHREVDAVVCGQLEAAVCVFGHDARLWRALEQLSQAAGASRADSAAARNERERPLRRHRLHRNEE
eukprot:2722602-Prymnesium_polylepis.1